MPGLRLITAPSGMPITVDEVKAWAKISDGTEDAVVIPLAIGAAVGFFERETRSRIISQTWAMTIDRWPSRLGEWWDGQREGAMSKIASVAGAIALPIAPVTAASLVAIDEAGGETTVTGTYLVADATRARIALRAGASIPATRGAGGLEVRMTVGYGENAAAVPADIRTALLMLATHFLERREAVSEPSLTTTPMGVRRLMAQYTVPAL
jgi:hypothetical protein